jgi:hypothetical protein
METSAIMVCKFEKGGEKMQNQLWLHTLAIDLVSAKPIICSKKSLDNNNKGPLKK